MTRVKSQDRPGAILEAAARVIAARGLSAPTAQIAKEAGISNGSLFTYFETKADLLNALYVALKTEMAVAAMDGLATDKDVRAQLASVWSGWLRWAISAPEKRRALAQLSVSDEITKTSRDIGNRAMAGMIGILERSRKNGPMRSVPLGLVASLMNAAADATADFMIHDARNAEVHCRTGFNAVWRMIA